MTVKTIKIRDPIGYVLIEVSGKDADHPRVMCGSHSNYGGNITRVERNRFGDICERRGDRRPKQWKTIAGARNRCHEWNEFISVGGSGGNIGKVEIVPIFRSNWHIRESLEQTMRFRDWSTIEKIIEFVDANDLGGELKL